MSETSPLDHAELREIAETLDEGNTQEAAARLGQLGDARAHEDAIDFLTTRLLYQRGRIDSDGAADRVGAILERVEHFPEAEEWLAELEGRTERSALGGSSARSSLGDAPARASPPPSRPPPSRAPSIDPHHPFFDELGPDDDITPTELDELRVLGNDEPLDVLENDALRPLGDDELGALENDALRPLGDDELRALGGDALRALENDALRPLGDDELRALGGDARAEAPPGADAFGPESPTRPGVRRRDPASEPPTRPDAARLQPSFEPPTRPDLRSVSPPRAEVPARSSYKPFDSLRAKEQLSAQAGRYRGGANDPGEVLGRPRRARSSHAPRPSSRAPADPERRIIEAFQMVRDGALDEARRLLPEEGAPTTSRPELRAMLGRVLLELGYAERATVEAAYALEHAPQSPEVRLVYVWSAVRHSRQRDDQWGLERAARLLQDSSPSPGIDASLLDALAACVEVRVGVPAVGLRLAQRALRGDASSVDGLAALAEAAALAGDDQRAEAALERLHAIAEDAAEQLAPRLQRLGVGTRGPASSATTWLPLEHTLSSGAREVARAGLEGLAAEALASSQVWPWEDPEAAASSALEFLSLAPVLRHFAPYDLSLRSIDRLEAALDLLYGAGPRALEPGEGSDALWQISGVYLGETLRACCGGSWLPAPPAPAEAVLELLGGEAQPLELVRRRLLHGRRATLASALAGPLALAPPRAHQARAPERFAPEPPWGEGAWPLVRELPRLGRALGHSVVGAYVNAKGYPRLDRTGQSLTSLDHYLGLIAPEGSPLAVDGRWTRWLSTFLGAYLGEVLCKELGATWALGERPDAEAFLVRLGSRPETPLAIVRDILTGRHRLALADYMEQLRHTLGSS